MSSPQAFVFFPWQTQDLQPRGPSAEVRDPASRGLHQTGPLIRQTRPGINLIKFFFVTDAGLINLKHSSLAS